MVVVFSAIILGVMYSIRVMTRLSIKIQHLREGKKGALSKQSDPFGVSFHGLPTPFFEEYSDTLEIRHLIRKRNQIVAGFWLVVLTLIIVSVAVKSVWGDA